jgi:DNA polymerase III epsilon subunit-like protein
MIILDTETTGLLKLAALGAEQQPQIIDFAAVKIDDASGDEIDRIEFLVNPGKPLEAVITKITGLTDADLASLPPFTHHVATLAEFFRGERAMIAHNMPFDKGLLYWELVRLDLVTSFPWPAQQLCTVQLHIEEFGHRPKLTELYEARMGKKLAQKHRAMADVEALLEIIRKDRLWQLVDGTVSGKGFNGSIAELAAHDAERQPSSLDTIKTITKLSPEDRRAAALLRSPVRPNDAPSILDDAIAAKPARARKAKVAK